MNLFRCGTLDGSLDKKYLRVCSVYKLLKKHKIGKSLALELLSKRHTASEMRSLQGTVEIWRAYPLKYMLP